MPYHVYVLLCEDGSYYTGYAKDIDSRFEQHMRGIGARYTKLHRPKKLVYAEEFDSRREAVKREREIKRLSHSEKHKLVSRGHALWKTDRAVIFCVVFLFLAFSPFGATLASSVL